MPQQFFAILTAIGEAKDANAKALGIPLVFTEMAVGDGNGALPVPDKTRTTLVRQVRRAPLNQLSRDPVNTNQVIAEQVIPETVGGWWIREIGLYDADGDLVAIANCPETYKPQLAEGSGRTQVVRMVLIISSADTVQLKVDPAVVLATRKYADDAITASMNAHLAAADPHPQYLNTAEGNAMIAAAIAALVNSSPATLDTLAELAAALGNDANFAATITNALTLKAPLASPALTGSPTAPTPPQFDTSTKIANMASVWRAVGNRAGDILYNVNGNMIDASDAGKTIILSNPGNYTVYLPVLSACPLGAELFLVNSNDGNVTLQRQGADVIASGGGIQYTSIVVPSYSTLRLINTNGAWHISNGDAGFKYSRFFNASFAPQGYQKLPSGIIIQWDKAISFSVTGANVTNTTALPTTFPNARLATVIGMYNNAQGFTANDLVALIDAGTTTSQTTVRAINATAGTTGYSIITVGY